MKPFLFIDDKIEENKEFRFKRLQSEIGELNKFVEFDFELKAKNQQIEGEIKPVKIIDKTIKCLFIHSSKENLQYSGNYIDKLKYYNKHIQLIKFSGGSANNLENLTIYRNDLYKNFGYFLKHFDKYKVIELRLLIDPFNFLKILKNEIREKLVNNYKNWKEYIDWDKITYLLSYLPENSREHNLKLLKNIENLTNFLKLLDEIVSEIEKKLKK